MFCIYYATFFSKYTRAADFVRTKYEGYALKICRFCSILIFIESHLEGMTMARYRVEETPTRVSVTTLLFPLLSVLYGEVVFAFF